MSPEHLLREAAAGFPKQRINLGRGQAFSENVDEVREKWNVRARQQLLHFRCDCVQRRWAGDTGPLTGSVDQTVAFHARQLRSDGVWGHAKFGCEFVHRHRPAPQQRNDASSRAIEKLFPQHHTPAWSPFASPRSSTC